MAVTRPSLDDKKAQRVARLLFRSVRERFLRGLEGSAERELPRALTRALSKHDILSFNVSSTGLEHDGIVTSEPRGADSVCAAMHREGLRRIDFTTGVDDRELAAVVDVIACAFVFEGIGDDPESRLRTHERDGKILRVRLTFERDAEREHSIEVDAEALIDHLVPRSEDIEREEVAMRWLGPKGFEPPAYAEELITELEAESEERVDGTVVDRALDVLVGASPEHAARAGRALEAFLDAKIQAGDHRRALSIIDRGKARLVPGSGGENAQERASAWLTSLGTEARLQTLARTYPESLSEYQIAEAMRLFGAFGEESMGAVVSVLSSIKNSELKRKLVATIVSGPKPPIERLVALVDERRSAEEAIAVIAALPGSDVDAALVGSSRHSSLKVRRAVLRAAERMSPNRKLLVGEAMLDDANPEVRVGAIQLVTAVGGPVALEILAGEAASDRLTNAPTSVQSAVLAGLSITGGTKSLPVLIQHVEEAMRPSADSARIELGKSAIQAMATVGTDESRRALEDLARGSGAIPQFAAQTIKSSRRDESSLRRRGDG